MKKFTTFLFSALFVFFFHSNKAQTTITCDSVLQTSTCAGGNVIIPFSITGSFPFGNVFTAQFSDWFGNFGAPVNIGTTMFTIGGNGIIFGTIPSSANFGLFYRIRVVSSNPLDTSNDSPNTVIVTQVAQLNSIIANPGDSACPGDTVTLFALNFANSYSWSTGDTTQSIQVTSSGIYSVTTVDALTCESTTSDTVVFDPSFCTGISESNMAAAFNVFPNPADEFIQFTYSASYGNDASLELMDGLGRSFYTTKMHLDAQGKQRIDIRDLPAGIYFLILHSGDSSTVKKIMVH